MPWERVQDKLGVKEQKIRTWSGEVVLILNSWTPFDRKACAAHACACVCVKIHRTLNTPF